MKKFISILIAALLCMSLQSCAVVTPDDTSSVCLSSEVSTTAEVVTAAATVAIAYYLWWDGVRYYKHPCDVYYAPRPYVFGGPRHFYDRRHLLYYKGHRHHPSYHRGFTNHRPYINHHPSHPNIRHNNTRSHNMGPRPSGNNSRSGGHFGGAHKRH